MYQYYHFTIKYRTPLVMHFKFRFPFLEPDRAVSKLAKLQAGQPRKPFTIIIYNKPTKCNSGSIVFINNYKYALHVSDALCIHLQEHYKL